MEYKNQTEIVNSYLVKIIKQIIDNIQSNVCEELIKYIFICLSILVK